MMLEDHASIENLTQLGSNAQHERKIQIFVET
jgi:hypothetical protein